jgi:hypothetical protein
MKYLKAAVVAAFAVALSAAPAHAYPGNANPYGGGYMGDQDGYNYWNMLNELGAPFGVAEATDFGRTVCNDMRKGMSEGQAVNIGASTGLDTRIVRLAVHGAEFHFCPDYF